MGSRDIALLTVIQCGESRWGSGVRDGVGCFCPSKEIRKKPPIESPEPPFKREADTMTIQELAVAPVAGNYYDDRHLWDAAHAIAADEMQPMPYRLASLAKMNELTGEDDPCDEAALREYLEFTTAAA